MAYRFDGTDDDVRFSPGALDGYTMGPVTIAVLLKRNAVSAWHGVLTMLDAAGGDTSVLIDAIEFDTTNHLTFWNGLSGSGATGDISGSTTGSTTDTTNFMIVGMSWGGASTAPRFHWKSSGGSWTHESLADSTGGSCKTTATADRIIIGTDPSGADDLAADVVCAGISKSTDADLTIEGLSFTDFGVWAAYGFEWLIGFEASGSLTDRTGGGGNEVSRSGTTLVADPAGWSWSAVALPTLVMAPRSAIRA